MTTATSSFSPIDFLARFYGSSIGKKVIMAVTGIIMWGFVIGHMAGNLQVFAQAAGPLKMDEYWGQSLNEYAHFLKTTPALLWGTRITLLVAIVLHIFTGVSLASQNRGARPSRYAGATENRNATIWSKTMPLTGLFVLGFIVFHLAHFTLGVVEPGTFAANRISHELPDVFNMVRDGFRNPIFVAIYVIGNALLIAHLVHGSQSVWQSFGLNHRSWTPIFRYAGWALVALILAGNLSIPLVLFSWAQGGAPAPAVEMES
jgi:succinate dehydrogenase / fumarate reductase cytochrome b subunit